MELSNSNLKKFLLFLEMETPKKFLIFSQKKAFLIFQETVAPKKFVIFLETELSYIFLKKVFLIVPERYI